jgi:hypothetical protein
VIVNGSKKEVAIAARKTKVVNLLERRGNRAMRSVRVLVIALAVGLPIGQALPYGALAVGQGKDGKQAASISYDQPRAEDARRTALVECEKTATSCSIVKEFSEMCFVYGYNAGGGFMFEFYQGGAVSQIDAARALVQKCPTCGGYRSGPCDTKWGTQNALEKERAKIEAAAKEKRKAVAEQDCPQTPTLTGGPWFSSTYKVGALDAARSAADRNNLMGHVFCVKSIEYLSDAPNPFGGKAARARFVVYDSEYRLVTQVRDFPY